MSTIIASVGRFLLLRNPHSLNLEDPDFSFRCLVPEVRSMYEAYHYSGTTRIVLPVTTYI
jgi:hypothetical protein